MFKYAWGVSKVHIINERQRVNCSDIRFQSLFEIVKAHSKNDWALAISNYRARRYGIFKVLRTVGPILKL